MKIRLFSVLILLLSAQCVFSQSEVQEKKFEKYFSIQANQLLRQLVNFGGSNQPINNPYLLNFSLNNSKSLFGFNVGFGYLVSDSEDKGENIDRETKARDLNFRIGLDKKTYLSEKWMLAFGLDILWSHQMIESDNSSPSPFDEDLQDQFSTESKARGFGFGPRMNLAFAISPRIMLSTEASYYLAFSEITGKSSSRINQRSFDNGSMSVIVVEQDDEDPTRKTDDLNLELPMVLNLIIRF